MVQKAWLRVRNLTARCLVAATRVPAADDTPTASLSHADGDSVNNGETAAMSRCPAMDAVKQLSNELKTTIGELSSTYASEQTTEVSQLLAQHITGMLENNGVEVVLL